MRKAEDRALEAYPEDIEEFVDINGVKSVVDNNSWQRTIFLEGYHQAEFDLQLTWEDIADILDVTDVIANDDSMEVRLKTMSEEEYCQEVLKRFKERKER